MFAVTTRWAREPQRHRDRQPPAAGQSPGTASTIASHTGLQPLVEGGTRSRTSAAEEPAKPSAQPHQAFAVTLRAAASPQHARTPERPQRPSGQPSAAVAIATPERCAGRRRHCAWCRCHLHQAEHRRQRPARVPRCGGRRSPARISRSAGNASAATKAPHHCASRFSPSRAPISPKMRTTSIHEHGKQAERPRRTPYDDFGRCAGRATGDSSADRQGDRRIDPARPVHRRAVRAELRRCWTLSNQPCPAIRSRTRTRRMALSGSAKS